MTAKTARTGTRKSATRRTPSTWGTTEQLPSGRWRARYRLAGRSIAAGRTFDTREQAAAWLAGEHADRSRGVWVDPETGSQTLADYAREWLAGRVDLTPRTAELYADTLERWVLPRFQLPGRRGGIELGSIELRELSPAVVRAWHSAMFDAARAAGLARQASASTARDPHPARRWAAHKGMSVPATGKLSDEVLRAWRAAGEPVLPVLRAKPEHDLASAGRSTAARAYALLRNICNAAKADELLTGDNPCRVRGAGQHTAAERSTANPAEVAALAAAMPVHLSAAVTLAAWSGLRRGELFALARRHVDLDAGTLRVERALLELRGQGITFGETKTRKSRRLVHLPPFAVAILEAHMREHVAAAPDALLFSTNGAPVSVSRLSQWFKAARLTVGRLDLTWHDLRHTGATLAYRAGASVPEVQARLGHTTMRAALIYAHAADDSDRILAERLDALYAAESTAPRLRAVG
ncbi:tyrosine-type recombinase/integrase [Agrococcus sp. KRD186]|uniref:tyrosine-type recombinase/integrase n=1 Tax=Agrococcus sp. KRD186 TaxID=2729730 RepID=UPI0019D110CD|nr:site-specific integrase [Agrococcus sp. KRD186]